MILLMHWLMIAVVIAGVAQSCTNPDEMVVKAGICSALCRIQYSELEDSKLTKQQAHALNRGLEAACPGIPVCKLPKE